MAERSRTEEERERDLERIAELYVRGYTQQAIANEIGVSRSQIAYDLKTIRTRWQASTLRNFDAAKEEELSKLDAVEQEAWDAYRRSQKEKQKTVTEKVEGDSSGRTKAQVTKETANGDPRFLAIIQTCIDRRCKILGIDAPTKIAPTDPTGEREYTGPVIIIPDNGRDRTDTTTTGAAE